MKIRDVLVIGASAGGFQPICELIQGIPSDLPVAVLIVIHTMPDGPGLLPQILNQFNSLHAEVALEGEMIQHGRIYVAPPGKHLWIQHQMARLSSGPKMHYTRP